MRFLCLAALALCALCLAASGSARTTALGAPQDVHGFLLRADEPRDESFARTPSFGWKPVPGASGYEFQLSTSSSFRDNGIIFADNTLTTPVAAPNVTLPWISGNPHSLYARARAVAGSDRGEWSKPFGFDMTAPAPPTPLAGAYPGILRWTPTEGATSYEVWLIDAKKMEFVNSNVLDEREFYTFHPANAWTATVRWRIRALRDDWSVGAGRLNSIPIAPYGAWSPVYSSSNPAPTGGAIKLLGTVSDVYSNGSPTAPAHRLMPAFLFSGNQTASGAAAELFRVYVFTDKQCLNPVLIGSPTGAPAFAPRPYGPLTLPILPGSLLAARSQYLMDVRPHTATSVDFGLDGGSLALSEQAAAATPTKSAPGAPGDPASSSSAGSSAGAAPAGGSSGGAVGFAGDTGAPINLWDTDWPSAGYYWTVIPVGAIQPGALSTFVRAPGSKATDVSIPVTSTSGFNVGDTITIGSGGTADSVTITGIGDGTLGVSALKFGHTEGQPASRTGGDVQYTDLELPQEVCASGRVARFGKDSEPSLTSSGNLFATGLSPNGRLTSALHTASFYGAPLVSWTPALGAEVYQVQWGKKAYPFVPTVPVGAKDSGILTSGTSAVLPLAKEPGKWWYRVRGFDYSLPTGAQQMSWSEPAMVIVTKPTFRIGKP